MRRKIFLSILVFIILIVPVIFKNKPSYIAYLNLAIVYAIAAEGLNLLLGVAGQISLGHAAFMAIGGYTSAILVMNFQMPSLLGILLGVVFSALFGFLIGFPSLRLKGFYLAIATMALSTAVTDVIKRLQITGSDHGLMNIPPIKVFGFSFSSEISKYYLFLTFLVFVVVLLRNLLKGKSGMSLRAMRDSEVGAISCGISISYYKILAFVISSALAGLAGALYAHSISYLHPMNFGLGLSIDFLAMTIIGGLGTILGPIYGSLLWVIVPRLFGSRLEAMASVLFGVILIAVILFLPKGLYEIVEKFDRMVKKPLGEK